jgi:hypothetical protein
MDNWERTTFAMTPTELEIHDAVVAMERVLEHCELRKTTRSALEQAVWALRGTTR